MGKLAASLLMALLLRGCTTSAQQPTKTPVNFDVGSFARADTDTVSFVMESSQDVTPSDRFHVNLGTSKSWPLGVATVVDSVSGNLLYNGINNSCRGQDIAIVGTVGSERSALLNFTIVTKGDRPMAVPVYHSFGAGVPLSTVIVNVYDDSCHPSNLRIALSFHRVK